MLAPGTLVDERYEIESTLGVGGYGAVYKAKQLQFDRTVALKILATNLLQQDDGAARFEREAQAINALKHKNIVSFYGYGVWNQAPYMVVEFVDGVSLQTEIDRVGKMDPRRALMLMKQIFEALASAHTSGIIHRDLKPSNIMLARSEPSNMETVKIIDFGLAKLMPGYGVPGQKLTETGCTLGSCHYMPPEQALGIAVDPRADIYAAGCVMYFMLAGRVPFDADTNIAIMMQHVSTYASSISDALGTTPMEFALSDFVDTCMAKERNDRFADCGHALTQIEAILSGAKLAVTPTVRPLREPLRFPVSVKLATALAIALCSVVMTGVVLRFLAMAKPLTASDLAVRRPGALRFTSHPVGSLPEYEQLLALHDSDHSLSAKEELRAIYSLVLLKRAQKIAMPSAEKVRWRKRIVALIDSTKLTKPAVLSDSDLVWLAQVLTDVDGIDEAVAIFQHVARRSDPHERESLLNGIVFVASNAERMDLIVELNPQQLQSQWPLNWVSLAALLHGDLSKAEFANRRGFQCPASSADRNSATMQRIRILLVQQKPKLARKIVAQLEVPDKSKTSINLELLRAAAMAGSGEATTAHYVSQLLRRNLVSVPHYFNELTRYDCRLSARYLADAGFKEDSGSILELVKLFPTEPRSR